MDVRKPFASLLLLITLAVAGRSVGDGTDWWSVQHAVAQQLETEDVGALARSLADDEDGLQRPACRLRGVVSIAQELCHRRRDGQEITASGR